jgi:hypothetical protein
VNQDDETRAVPGIEEKTKKSFDLHAYHFHAKNKNATLSRSFIHFSPLSHRFSKKKVNDLGTHLVPGANKVLDPVDTSEQLFCSLPRPAMAQQ